MKKLILLLLIPSLCFAGSIKVEDGGGNVAYDYIAPVSGASMNTTDMTRGFEADSDPAGWAAETDTAGILSRYDSAQKHSGSYSMSVAGGVTTAAYIRYDMGATKAALSLAFWFYAPSCGSNDALTIYTVSVNTGSHGIRLYYQRDASGHYHFGLRGTTFVYGSVDVPTGAWYRVELDYAQNATSTITIYNDGGAQVDTVSVTASDNASQYSYVGKLDTSARTTWTTLYIDDIGLDYTDATSPLWEYTVAN